MSDPQWWQHKAEELLQILDDLEQLKRERENLIARLMFYSLNYSRIPEALTAGDWDEIRDMIRRDVITVDVLGDVYYRNLCGGHDLYPVTADWLGMQLKNALAKRARDACTQ